MAHNYFLSQGECEWGELQSCSGRNGTQTWCFWWVSFQQPSLSLLLWLFKSRTGRVCLFSDPQGEKGVPSKRAKQKLLGSSFQLHPPCLLSSSTPTFWYICPQNAPALRGQGGRAGVCVGPSLRTLGQQDSSRAASRGSQNLLLIQNSMVQWVPGKAKNLTAGRGQNRISFTHE